MRLWRAFCNAVRPSRRRPTGPDEAESLLGGGHVPAHPELSRLLAAATAPPRPDELTGLDAALAAFEDAGRIERPAPTKPRRRVLRPLAVAAATAVVLFGGAAVAAETGYLPGNDRPPAGESVAPRDTRSSTPRTSPGATSGPTRTPDTSASAPAVAPADKAAAARLCRAWDDRQRKGKAIKREDLRELARLAGGEDQIPAFCAPLLPPHGGGPAASPPSPTPPSPGLSSDDDDSDDSKTKQPDKQEDDQHHEDDSEDD